MLHFDAVKIYSCENIVRKGEIACNKQFLLFSQCFLPYLALTFHFKCTLKCRLAICFNLDQSKILSSGIGLINYKIMNRTKLKAFADDNPNKTEKNKNIVKKEKMLGYQHFLLCPQWFFFFFLFSKRPLQWDR